MNDHNNGKAKVFELAPVKSQEEIQQEAAREIAPKIRRAIWFSKLPVAAKGFFAFLLDMTFFYNAGGNGNGKLFTTTRKLARDFRVDKDSITKWRRVLAQEKILWFREGWPRSEYRITAICPAPVEDLPWDEETFNAGKMASQEAVRQNRTGVFLAENSESPHESDETGQVRVEKPTTLSHGTGQTVPQNRTHGGILPDTSVPQNRTGGPIEPDAVSDAAGRMWRKVGDKGGGSVGTTKESPMEKRSKGDKECGASEDPGASAHTNLPKFEPLDTRMLPRLRREHGQDMIERLKSKRGKVELDRKPIENRKAVMAAYSRRIRDVQDWMAGILPEEKAVRV